MRVWNNDYINIYEIYRIRSNDLKKKGISEQLWGSLFVLSPNLKFLSSSSKVIDRISFKDAFDYPDPGEVKIEYK